MARSGMQSARFYADHVDGGAGDDSLYFSPNDTVTGGEGHDLFSFLSEDSSCHQILPGSATITDYDTGDRIEVQLHNSLTSSGAGAILVDTDNLPVLTILGAGPSLTQADIHFVIYAPRQPDTPQA